MTKKRKILYTNSFLLALTLIFFGDYSVFAAEPYKKNLIIGVVGPISGTEAHLGKPIADGVRLAADEFNKAGGINGQKIELIIHDNEGSLGKTDRALEEFLQKKVAAIIASPSGWTTFAPVAVANRSWTILMSVGTQRHMGKSGPFIFRNSLSAGVAIDAVIKYATEKMGYKRYVLITSMVDDEASLEAAGFYKKSLQKFNGKIVAEEFTNFDVGLSDAISNIKKITNGSIDAVIYAGNAKNGADVLKELRKQGIKAPLIGGEGLKSSQFLKLAGKAAIGTLLHTSFTTLSKNQNSKNYTKNFRKAYGKYPNPLSALGYDSFMLIAEAIKKTGSTEPKKVVDSLMDTKKFPGVSCSISVDEYGESVYEPYILKVGMGKKRPVFRLAQ